MKGYKSWLKEIDESLKNFKIQHPSDLGQIILDAYKASTKPMKPDVVIKLAELQSQLNNLNCLLND